MDEAIRELIHQAIDQAISPADFERLQDAIEQDDEVRTEYLRAVHLSESLGEIAAEANRDAISFREGSETPRNVGVVQVAKTRGREFSPVQLTAAAAVLVLVSGVAFWFGQRNVPLVPGGIANTANREASDDDAEATIAGHATLRRAVGMEWAADAATWREGDVLPDGRLKFDNGLAEIDFFCGATLIVEGPATLDIISDWSVHVIQGRLRANVPPAARGFIVQAADAEIIDLGTEFALEVGAENARVEVIDGEVKLRGGRFDGDHLVTGERQLLRGSQASPLAFEGLSTIDDVQRRGDDAAAKRFAEWKQYSSTLRKDARLIAYYPIAEGVSGRVVGNAADTGASLNGNFVGLVKRSSGRFGATSTGVEFGRPGARVRTRIDGEFEAFTFSCWVRIESLEHVYNALFMADGYENGEPHWQIRDDGRLMFSVMVDDSQEVRVPNRVDRKIVRDAGLHRVYFTKPFWDISKSGQWFHIAAVYDPTGRRVSQYVNGEQLSDEPITDKFHIAKLRIGTSEIGNWGQPFRETPWFAVRNLNGAIDELSIFNAALSPREILLLYERGKPLGY